MTRKRIARFDKQAIADIKQLVGGAQKNPDVETRLAHYTGELGGPDPGK